VPSDGSQSLHRYLLTRSTDNWVKVHDRALFHETRSLAHDLYTISLVTWFCMGCIISCIRCHLFVWLVFCNFYQFHCSILNASMPADVAPPTVWYCQLYFYIPLAFYFLMPATWLITSYGFHANAHELSIVQSRNNFLLHSLSLMLLSIQGLLQQRCTD